MGMGTERGPAIQSSAVNNPTSVIVFVFIVVLDISKCLLLSLCNGNSII